VFYFFLLGRALALLVPREVCYMVARLAAAAHYKTSRKDWNIIRTNLAQVVAPGELDQRTKEVFENFAYYLVDFFRYSKIDKKFIEKYVRITGREHLDRCRSQGRGIINLSAHLGNYELGGAVISMLGYSLHAVALPHKDKRTNRFFDKQRGLAGMDVIPSNLAVKKCFSLLKKGEMVGFVGDRIFTDGGVKMRLCGGTAMLPRGAEFFALKTGAYVIPTFLVREEKKYYRLIFEEPIDCSGGFTENEITQKYADVLGKYIRDYPGQWYMFAKFWLDAE